MPEHAHHNMSVPARAKNPAPSGKSGTAVSPILSLQRTIGNQAVQRLLAAAEGEFAAPASTVSQPTAETSPRERRPKPISHAQPRIQRFDSPEHVSIGENAGGPSSGNLILEAHRRDLPQYNQSINSWPAAWQTLWMQGDTNQRRFLREGLTYGEVVALSGDFYTDYSHLNNAPLREIYDLLPSIRDGATTSELQETTGGRYLDLAAHNENHFTNVTPGHSNLDTWRRMHVQAILAARNGDANMAWGMNATADHYLTDAFSGGHLRVERSELMTSTMGNIESKILHDLDNNHGVDVTNARGDVWTAYGDENYNEPVNARNRELVQEAVRLSKQDIADALAQGTNYPEPSPETHFAAEQLVPRPVDPSQDRWTGRMPSYAVGPDGTPVRQADDYTQTRDHVIVNEAPGVLSGLLNDDNQVVEWVSRNDLAAIGRQPVSEKIRMINTLIGGTFSVVTDDDMAAIERICESVPNAAEMAQIRAAIDPLRFSGLGDRTRFRIAVSRL